MGRDDCENSLVSNFKASWSKVGGPKNEGFIEKDCGANFSGGNFDLESKFKIFDSRIKRFKKKSYDDKNFKKINPDVC